MNKQTFDIDKETPKKIRRAESGHSQIIVLESGKPVRFFFATDFVGGLSLIRLLGEYPESLLINYGHDLANGWHHYDYPQDGSLQYVDPDDQAYYEVVSGELDVFVQRADFGPGFRQVGLLRNVRFERNGHAVVLHGTYEVSVD